MKKYKIELSEKQMTLISQCIEDISRFASGQPELSYTIQEMLKELPFDEQIRRRDVVENKLNEIKKILLPDLIGDGSKSYNGSTFIGNTYQIYRTILHRLALDNNYNNVYSSTTLPSGDLGTIKIEKIKD